MIWSGVHRMFRAHRRRLALLVLSSSLAGERAVADCTPRTHQSPCVDADPLWLTSTPSPFIAIPGAESLPAHAWSAALGVSYSSRPITLVAPSPDPNGREVRVVDDLIHTTLGGGMSPARHLELSLLVPFVSGRTGTGLTGITSQNGPEVSAVAFGDVRVGVGHDLVLHPGRADPKFRAMSRLDIALPTGGAFAGSRGVTISPSFAFSARAGRAFFGATLGARVRAISELGDARLGTELVGMLGGGVDLLERHRLSLALESWALPSLASQGRTLPDGTVVTESSLVPAEWMLSARTVAAPFIVQLGVGTGIPLSSETRRHPDGTETTEHFAGMTTPRFRATLVVKYAPAADTP